MHRLLRGTITMVLSLDLFVLGTYRNLLQVTVVDKP